MAWAPAASRDSSRRTRANTMVYLRRGATSAPPRSIQLQHEPAGSRQLQFQRLAGRELHPSLGEARRIAAIGDQQATLHAAAQLAGIDGDLARLRLGIDPAHEPATTAL